MVAKRLFDFSVSAASLLVLIPAFIIIGLIIKLKDKGPVFFIQKRVGQGGSVFKMYKFRTMSTIVPAEEGLFGPANLSSVTRFGKFLRRTKLNELPQLINVFKGVMSIVGPRPEVEKWVTVYPDRWAHVLQVKPGITDKASIGFWNEEYVLAHSEDPEKTYKDIILPLKLDIYEDYVENHSFSNDLKLIFATLSVFLFRNNFLKINLEGHEPSIERIDKEIPG
jgi:lipopolysaccharide/colanic/teichoic acid biosynthesis glycosyltransferase